MKGEEAVELFALIKQENLLPGKVEELVPLSFIGQAAVSFYRQKIKLMDQLKMTEDQRRATLRDGQDAGEMLLDIEARIGELAEKEERAKPVPIYREGHRAKGAKPSGQPPKHERLGIPEKRMQQSQAIHRHPDVVAKIKAQARENEDIPTKTAVLSEIKYEKEKKRREQAEKKRQEIKAVVNIEQTQYLNALDRCISILPQKPPKNWNEEALKEAIAKAKIIIKRLEVFHNG
jgi:hypothetical protein